MNIREHRRAVRRLRVCILTETYHPVVGGGEKQAQALAADLVARGVGTMVVTRRSSPALSKTEKIDGIPVYRVSPVGSASSSRWRMLFSSFWLLAARRREYDVVFVSGFKALGLVGVCIAKLFGKVCILKADSNGEMSGDFFASGLKRFRMTTASPPFRMFLAVRNRILRHADHFVAITSGIVDELTSGGIDPAHIHPITNSVDTARFTPAAADRRTDLRQRLAIPQKEILIAYTGRLVTYKGLPLLMKVAQQIAREHENVGFVLIGSGGLDIHNCETELREYVSANHLEDTIHFAGEVSNVDEYLQSCDIFVFPSEDDAFPLALIEAMACGLPVVTTPVGGIRDIVTHGENGLFVQPRDARELHDALLLLIGDEALAASLGNAAARTVHARYSRETVACTYAELFMRTTLNRRERRWRLPRVLTR